MTRRDVVILTCALMVAPVVPLAAIPIFGGLPVIDAGNLTEAIIHTGKWGESIAKAVQLYNKTAERYNFAVNQAKHIMNMSQRYRSPSVVWRGVTVNDSTGKLGPWVAAVNSGIAAVDGWTRGTLPRVPIIVNAFPPSHRPRLQSILSTMDLQDGSGISAMDTLGRIRVAGPQTETALQQLESDSLSNSADMNTEAAQMNKANAIAMVQTRALADANKLLVTNAELALLRVKRERDDAVHAMQAESVFRAGGAAALTALHADATSEMLAYRIP